MTAALLLVRLLLRRTPVAWSEGGDIFVSIDLEENRSVLGEASAQLSSMCVLGDDVYWFNNSGGETYLIDPATGYAGEDTYANLDDNMKAQTATKRPASSTRPASGMTTACRSPRACSRTVRFDRLVDLPTRVQPLRPGRRPKDDAQRKLRPRCTAAGPFYAMTPSRDPAVKAATA